MRRPRPKQHKRRLKSGKVIVVNRGVKSGAKNKSSRYTTSAGKFKKMTVPGTKSRKKSKFGGSQEACNQEDILKKLEKKSVER